MAVFNVATAAQLQSALATAAGGDSIFVAAGDYGKVSISNRNYASAVTISTSVSNPAHFDGLFISNSSNLNFSGLDLGRALTAGEPESTQLNWVRNSSNIKFDHITVHGSNDGDPTNDGTGLQMVGVSGISITNSTFAEVYRGIAMKQSSNMTINGNDFHLIRSDGVVVASTVGISIDGNSFTDFHPILPDHADAIQFWNTGETSGSANITIKNNVIMPGYASGIEGTGVQGIFIADPLSYGYKNVLIQNNVMYSDGAYNGITVAGGTDVYILDNSVLSRADDSKEFWIRLSGGSNIYLEHNLTDNIVLKDVTNLYQSDNINLRATPEFRASLPSLNDPSSAHDLIVSNLGYQTPVAPPKAVVSDMVGRSLSSMFAKANGTALTAVAADESASISGALHLPSQKSALVSAVSVADGTIFPASSTHVAAAIDPLPHTAPMLSSLSLFTHDYYVALP